MKFHGIKCVLLVAIVAVSSGCVTQQKPLYTYKDYSNSYYKSAKTSSEESYLKLQASMEKAIESAGESRSGRVPPGMYANLGYLYLKRGEANKALTLFEKEKKTYPESSHFMDRIIQKTEQAEGEVK